MLHTIARCSLVVLASVAMAAPAAAQITATLVAERALRACRLRSRPVRPDRPGDRREDRAGEAAQERCRGGHAISRPVRCWCAVDRRGTRAARPRLRARLRHERPRLRELHRRQRLVGCRAVSPIDGQSARRWMRRRASTSSGPPANAPSRTRRCAAAPCAAITTAAISRSAPTDSSISASGMADRPTTRCISRRTRSPTWARWCASTCRCRSRTPKGTTCRPPIRFWACPCCQRSGPSACAIRGAGVSTTRVRAARERWSSAMSGRGSARRWTTSRWASPVSTMAGAIAKGRSPTSPVRRRYYTPLRDPLLDYDRNTGRSITGGFVYRGQALGASLRGRYFYADFVTSRVWSVSLTIDPATGEATAGTPVDHTAELGVAAANPSSFGVDAAGELYIVNYINGQIHRIDSQWAASGRRLYVWSIPTWPSGGGLCAGGAWLSRSRGTDFTSDEHADLLFANASKQLYAWFMQGRTRVGGTFLTPGQLASTRNVVGINDFNGDDQAGPGRRGPGDRRRVRLLPDRHDGGDRTGAARSRRVRRGGWWPRGTSTVIRSPISCGGVHRRASTTCGSCSRRPAVSRSAGLEARSGAAFSPTPEALGLRSAPRGARSVRATSMVMGSPTCSGRTARPARSPYGRLTGRSSRPTRRWRQAARLRRGCVRAVGDFNHDQHVDLVWEHQTTGQLYVWFMVGRRLAQGAFLAPNQVNPIWQITGPRVEVRPRRRSPPRIRLRPGA